MKNILITGASSEVGINLIDSFGDGYGTVFAQYRTPNGGLEELKEKLGDRLELIQADFSQPDGVNNMVDAINATGKTPDAIVHLPAPKAYNQKFHKDVWENYQKGIDISVRSAVETVKAFIPAMVKNRYGRIVFMLTSCTQNFPAKYQASYVTVKYAILGLMKSLSVEYMEKGITVNGISPEMMETKFLSEIPDLLIEQNAAQSPLGRNVRVDEIIPIIRYMLSDEGAAMTGQNIAVTGGVIRS